MKKLVVMLAVIVALFSAVWVAEAARCPSKAILCQARERASRVSATPAPVLYSETPVQNSIESECDMSYPNSQIPGTCAYATRVSQLATWTAANCAAGDWVGGELECIATVIPSPTSAAYPPAYP